MKEKIIVGLFYLACVVMVIWGGKVYLQSAVSSRDEQEFLKTMFTEKCKLSVSALTDVDGERIIEKYGNYRCYAKVKGIWVELSDYEMDKILGVRR